MFISYISIPNCSLLGKSKESKAVKKSQLIPKGKNRSQREKDTEGRGIWKQLWSWVGLLSLTLRKPKTAQVEVSSVRLWGRGPLALFQVEAPESQVSIDGRSSPTPTATVPETWNLKKREATRPFQGRLQYSHPGQRDLCPHWYNCRGGENCPGLY